MIIFGRSDEPSKVLTRFSAFQSLITINNLQKGEDVLIHAGASGVGIAATQLSHLYGA